MGDQVYIHDDMKLYTTSEKFFFEPTIDPTEVLVIDRVSGQASVQAYGTVKIPAPPDEYKPVCGFLGSIKLISGLYLIVAKYRILIGKINGHDVYELAGVEAIPYAKSNIHLTSKQIELNTTYERMLLTALETPGMYFSYGLDLTHTLQRTHSASGDYPKMSLISRADPRFLWNGFLLKDYSDMAFARFALPLIQGFVSINRVLLNGHQVTWAVVSRRSVDRAGTRLFIRGADVQGNVANFVETEQIIERGNDKASFVQTRGSIPLYWSQYPNLKYKPELKLEPMDHVAVYIKHMRDQLQRYGNQVLINLIDQCGKEEALERGYRAAVAAAALPSVRYEPFDFHAECKSMRYDRLSVLMDRVAHEQAEFGHFLQMGCVIKKQTGVFRTNCIDCLDRTNVVQSLLARRNLVTVLRTMNVVREGEPLDVFDGLFNTVWADHADMISIQYSGTGALKTDFTRTGKRTYAGLIRDGLNSLTRYYKNNFSDGFRQDAVDLLLGKHPVLDGEGNTTVCPLERPHTWKYYTFPSVLLVAMSMFCASAIMPQKYDTEALMYLVLWGACVASTLTFIIRNDKLYVDWPRLDAGGLISATPASGLNPYL